MNKNLSHFFKIFFTVSAIYYLHNRYKIFLKFFHNFLNFKQLFFLIFSLIKDKKKIK